jgi:hypothetical protein
MDILDSGKGRGKMSLCTPWRHTRGAQVQLYSFLNSTLDKMNGELHDPAALHPRKSHRYPLTRRLDRPKPVLAFLRRDTSLIPVGNRTPDRPAHSTVKYTRTALSRVTIPAVESTLITRARKVTDHNGCSPLKTQRNAIKFALKHLNISILRPCTFCRLFGSSLAYQNCFIR